MKKILFSLTLFLLANCLCAQISINFTGNELNNTYVHLNRVVIMDVTQNWQDTLFYPDTVLTMGSVGIVDYEFANDFILQQNNPNPFEGTTYATLKTLESGDLVLKITDMSGRVVETFRATSLQPGMYHFRIQVAQAGILLLTAVQNGKTSSIKMLNKEGGGPNNIESITTVPISSSLEKAKDQTYKPFAVGDEMIYLGYATANGTEYVSQMVHQRQYESENLVLRFNLGDNNDGRPCEGTPIVTDFDGNRYATVQIGEQCWLKDNMRTTHYADGTNIAYGNTSSDYVRYRYCPDDNSDNVPTYGYLYNLPAAMNGAGYSYFVPSGVQGVCPNGWHIPSADEWRNLSQYIISHPEYSCVYENSFGVGKALASTTGWNSSSGNCAVGNDQSTNNILGFNAFPAGNYRAGVCENFGNCVNFWSASSSTDFSLDRTLIYDKASFLEHGSFDNVAMGYSVRCLRDEPGIAVYTTAVTNALQTTAISGGTVLAMGVPEVTARGVCWGTEPNPTVDDAHTTDGSGAGSFTSSITSLAEGSVYYVRAYATNSEGTTYGASLRFTTSYYTTEHPCPNTPTVTDYDGNTYSTVLIGNQCWMKENLKTTHYADGTDILLGQSANSDSPRRYYPGGYVVYVYAYGYLYNWSAVMHNDTASSSNPSGVQGICPNGWHLPSDSEWTELTDYVRSQPEYVCSPENSLSIAKALASTHGWAAYTDTPCNVGADTNFNNATGFSVLPAGTFYSYASGMASEAAFWSTTQHDIFDNQYYTRYLASIENRVCLFSRSRDYACSVRCVRNEEDGKMEGNE